MGGGENGPRVWAWLRCQLELLHVPASQRGWIHSPISTSCCAQPKVRQVYHEQNFSSASRCMMSGLSVNVPEKTGGMSSQASALRFTELRPGLARREEGNEGRSRKRSRSSSRSLCIGRTRVLSIMRLSTPSRMSRWYASRAMISAVLSAAIPCMTYRYFRVPTDYRATSVSSSSSYTSSTAQNLGDPV